MDDLSSEVRRYLRYLRRYWWLVIAGAVLGVLGMFALNRLSSSTEQGVAIQELLVVSDRWMGMASTTQPEGLFAEDPDALAVAVTRLSGTAVAARLQERFDLDRSAFSVTVDGRNIVMQLRTDAQVARAAGAVLVSELDESRARDTLAPIERTIRVLERRAEALAVEVEGGTTTGAREAEAVLIETELDLLRWAANAIPSGLRSDIVRQTAIAATAPASGDFSPFLTLVGVAAGALAAIVAVIVWSVLDRRLTTRRDVEAITGLGSLLAVIPADPNPADLKAAAAAVAHLQPDHPELSLVPVGRETAGVAASIATLTTTPCVEIAEVLNSPTAAAWVPVAGSGQVTGPELERLQFVVERAGGGVAGVILVGGRDGVDLLD